MTQQTHTKWAFADRVINEAKPEWGSGQISSVRDMKAADGSSCQRLVIRFERAGLKTISTEHAKLASADGSGDGSAVQGTTAVAEPAASEPLHNEDTPIEDRLITIPMRCKDPFDSPAQRLAATFKLFEFDASPHSLLDWASTMTGLSDPLSKFNRHELEAAFERFDRTLRAFARELVAELKRSDPAAVNAAMKAAPERARRALQGRGAR